MLLKNADLCNEVNQSIDAFANFEQFEQREKIEEALEQCLKNNLNGNLCQQLNSLNDLNNSYANRRTEYFQNINDLDSLQYSPGVKYLSAQKSLSRFENGDSLNFKPTPDFDYEMAMKTTQHWNNFIEYEFKNVPKFRKSYVTEDYTDSDIENNNNDDDIFNPTKSKVIFEKVRKCPLKKVNLPNSHSNLLGILINGRFDHGKLTCGKLELKNKNFNLLSPLFPANVSENIKLNFYAINLLLEHQLWTKFEKIITVTLSTLQKSDQTEVCLNETKCLAIGHVEEDLKKTPKKLEKCESNAEVNKIDKNTAVNEDRNSQRCLWNKTERERKRKSDREEILRRLAMGVDFDSERTKRKSNLQSRLVSGMNLQVCFINEATSDSESSDTENMSDLTRRYTNSSSMSKLNHLQNKSGRNKFSKNHLRNTQIDESPEVDEFTAKQERLQLEARMALVQAQRMARMQIEIERHQNKYGHHSPVTEIVKLSVRNIDPSLVENRRRLTRPILSKLTVQQLQAIADDFSGQIDKLNSDLMRQLVSRDDLHMEQDSMLVDIEDLSYKYNQLQAKHNQSSKTHPQSIESSEMNNKNLTRLITPSVLTSKLAKYSLSSNSLFNIAAMVRK